MVAVGSSFFIVPDRHPVPGGPGPELVVWLRGRYDASTESALCLTLARAIAVNGPGLVLDLTEVPVMGRSTLEVIVRTGVPPPPVSVVDGSVPLGPCPAPDRRLQLERPPGGRAQRSGRRSAESGRCFGPRTSGRAVRRTAHSVRLDGQTSSP